MYGPRVHCVPIRAFATGIGLVAWMRGWKRFAVEGDGLFPEGPSTPIVGF